MMKNHGNQTNLKSERKDGHVSLFPLRSLNGSKPVWIQSFFSVQAQVVLHGDKLSELACT